MIKFHLFRKIILASLIVFAFSAHADIAENSKRAMWTQALTPYSGGLSKDSRLTKSNLSQSNIDEKIQWLKDQGVKDAGKFLSDYPEILRLSVLNDLNPKIEWLKAQGVTDTGKFLSSNQTFLQLSLVNNLIPKVEWLKAQGVTDTGKFLSSYPIFLQLSLVNNLIPKVEWLRAQGVTDIGKLLSMTPQVFSYSISENLEPKIEWLKAQGIKDVPTFLTRFPAVSRYSISENLEPTMEEFFNHWGMTISDIEGTPMLLGASLERVRKLRLFLDKIAQIAGFKNFDITRFPKNRRQRIIKEGTVETFIKNLKSLGAFRSKVSSISNLTPAERDVISYLYQTHAIENILMPSKDLSPDAKELISLRCRSYLMGLIPAL